jgi:hypothetical protein
MTSITFAASVPASVPLEFVIRFAFWLEKFA